MKVNILYVVTVIACLVIGFGCGMRERRQQPPQEVTRIDTVFIYDTMRIDHFREVTKMVRDTVLIAVTDTVVQNDTVFARLPREEVTIKDSLFTAQISGVQPKLDWIELTLPTKVITLETVRREPSSRWSLGATAGLGAVYNESGIHAGLGTAFGLSYRF